MKDNFSVEYNKYEDRWEMRIHTDYFFLTKELADDMGIDGVIKLMMARFRESHLAHTEGLGLDDHPNRTNDSL